MSKRKKRKQLKKSDALLEAETPTMVEQTERVPSKLRKKTKTMRMFFWIKFLLCIVCALIAQGQTIDAALFSRTLSPAIIVSDVLRTLAWGLCALIIYHEYKLSQPTAMVIRLFWIASLVFGIVKDVGLITELMQTGHWKSWFFWTYQTYMMVCLAVTILGCIGFSPKMRKVLEPRLPESQLESNSKFSLKDMLGLFKDDWYMWIIATLFAIAHGSLTITFLSQIGTVINIIAPIDPGEVGDLKTELLIFSAYGISAAIAAVGNYIMHGVATHRLVNRLQRKLLGSLLTQEMAFFDKISVGALISHLNIDTDKIGLIREILPWIVNPICQVVSGAVILIFVSWKLSVVLFGLLIFELIEAGLRSKYITYRYSKVYSTKNRDALERGTEILSSFTTVRLFGQEKLETSSFEKFSNILLKSGTWKEFLESLFDGLETLLHATVIVLGTKYCDILVRAGEMDPRGIDQFVLVGVAMITSFQEVIKQAPKLASAAGPASIIQFYINRMPRVETDMGDTPPSVKGAITFKDVNFTYPNGFSSSFNKFNLHVEAGTSTAFVGPSGCGKSTLFKLMLRFYDTDSGDIIIDDEHRLKELNLRWWLSNIGVVSQEAVIFKGTLRDNVLYGVSDQAYVTDEHICEALKRAQLQPLIDEKGLDYQVGERGSKLSGGQKQRVAIARIFLRNPSIILLDEVTSALDPNSEAEIIKTLNELTKGRTTFVIAHRLHTIKDVDNILVLKDGAIIDQGKHDELTARPGFYQHMWNKIQKGDHSSEDDGEEGQILAATHREIEMLLDLVEQTENLSPAATEILHRFRPQSGPGQDLMTSDFDSDYSEYDEGSRKYRMVGFANSKNLELNRVIDLDDSDDSDYDSYSSSSEESSDEDARRQLLIQQQQAKKKSARKYRK